MSTPEDNGEIGIDGRPMPRQLIPDENNNVPPAPDERGIEIRDALKLKDGWRPDRHNLAAG